MRPFLAFALVLALLAPTVRADESALAARFPAGATVYVEVNGLAGRVQTALASPLGKSLLEHPALKQFLASPQGMQVLFAQGMLQGMTGMDVEGVLGAIAGKRIGVALYGGAQRIVVMAEVDRAAVEKLLVGAEMITKQQRATVLPAEEGLAALWQIGPAFFCLDGDLLMISPDQLLATSIRGKSAEGFASGETYRTARSLVAPESLLFVCGDLKPYAAALAAQGLPKDLGQAFFTGAFAHYLPVAGWAAVGVDLRAGEGGATLEVQGHLPIPQGVAEGVAAAYGGTLEPLPFALPERTLAVVRMRRDLSALWSNREELIAERGIPGMIEFETNFGNITSGMSWVEEFLPSMGKEIILVGTRREFAEGEAAPTVRYPEGALLVPFNGNADVKMRLEIAFHSGVTIINLQQAQMKGMPLMPAVEEYKGVRLQCARYLSAPSAEMEMQRGLPARYNFSPAMALMGDYLAIATSDRILKELIDGMGRPTDIPMGRNSILEVRGDETRKLLLENRESFIAQRMLEKSASRQESEEAVDLGLGFASYVRDLSLTIEEGRSTLGVRMKLNMAPPAAPAPAGQD